MRVSKLAAVVIVALPLLAVTNSAIAKSLSSYNPPAKPASEILEGQIQKAWKDWQTKDTKSYESILADGYVSVEPDGRGPHDRVATIADIQNTTVTNYSLSDFKFTPLGEKAQLATYRANADMTNGTNSFHAGLAVTEVWVKEGNDWKLLHSQETEVK
jgi:hypothetical protein